MERIPRLFWLPCLAAAMNAHADAFVTTTSGTRVEFRDIRDGCPDVRIPMVYERCRSFELQGDFWRVGFALVRRQDYESAAWFLVDRDSGRITEIDGIPFFSPDGKRFLIINDDVANDHPYNIAVWRRVADGAEVEWSHAQWRTGDPAERALAAGVVPYITEPLGWAGDRITLAFHLPSWYEQQSGRVLPARSWTGSLRLTDGRWVLQGNWPDPDAR